MIIDSLTHILPEEISKNLNQFKKLDSIFNDFFDKNTKIVQAEQLINQMKKNGINKSVTAGFGWTNHELAIMVNDYILLSKKQFPEEIIPFCSLDINSKKSEEELLRCISKGVKGIGELHINNLENILDNKIFNNILKIALHYNLPIIIHGSEPIGHKYRGKGRSYPKFLFKLVEKNQDNIFIFSHFGGGLVFYEQMPEIKKISTNVYYDSAAQPFLYDKSIYRTSILSSSINKILFASDFPLIDLNKCLKQTDYLTDIEKKHIFSYNPISVFNL